MATTDPNRLKQGMTEMQRKAGFVSFCIEQYAKAKGVQPEEAAALFERYGVTAHYTEFYDVLHTQGLGWIVDDIDEFIEKRRAQ